MNYQNVNVKTAKQGVQNKMKSLSKNHSSILKVPFPSSINLFGNISVPNPQLTNPRLIYLQDLSFFVVEDIRISLLTDIELQKIFEDLGLISTITLANEIFGRLIKV